MGQKTVEVSADQIVWDAEEKRGGYHRVAAPFHFNNDEREK